MAFSFITETNVFDNYIDAKKYTEALTEPFVEFERIARNRPHDAIDKHLPTVTDGTTASIIRKTPRRVIQQLPTGRVVSDSNDWLTVVADFIYTHKILRYANEEYDLIQKGWAVVEKGLTFGSCATYTPFLDHDGYLCPDMLIPYWADVFLQRGKKSGYACDYVFMRSWWQKSDIQALISQETKKSKSKTYDGTWDTGALQSIVDNVTSKETKALSPSERDRQEDVSNGIELVTAFQKGVKAKFYTFHPQTRTIVRTKINKDPRGKMPMDFMYGDIDGTNPLGRGIVELVGPLQNLIDGDMQAYQFNRALMLAPPIIKRGNFSKNKVKYLPNQIIDVGTDPSADVIPIKIDTTAVANYPALYGLQKSQLLNLTNSPDTSISADVGNPSFSKTPQGVQAQQATISVDDNYVRKMFEAWFEKWSETAINIYFAERTGIEELQLDKITAAKLRDLPSFDETLISPDNKIRINYDDETEVMSFKVDPSTTSVKDQAAQVADATQLLDMVMKYPMLNANFGGAIDVDVLARRIVNNTGIDDPEQIAPEPTEQQKQQKEQMKQSVSPFSPMYDKPSISIAYRDVEDPQSRAKLLELAGAPPAAELAPLSPSLAESAARSVGQIIPEEQGGPSGETANPVDIGDIYKQTTDPLIKAQIEKMAGLQPDPGHVINQVNTNDAQHAAAQMQAQAPDAESPAEDKTEPKEEPNKPQKGIKPEDQQLISVLQQAGFPPDKIGQALAMLHHGKSEQEILSVLGVSNG